MKLSEALARINEEAERIRLTDPFGEPMQGPECMGVVARFASDRWDEAERAFLAGEISPEEYAERVICMIRDFEGFQFKIRLERCLDELMKDQKELGV